jgi:lipopolysaccharide export system permease protein
MPVTLIIYFFTRYIKTIFWFSLGVSAIIFLVDFSTNSGRVPSRASSGLSDAMWLTLARLPFLLQQTIPFVVLFTTMIALIALNRKYELVVARAAGISVWQFMLPFAGGAFLIGILSTTVLNPLSAKGMQMATGMEASLGIGNGNQSNQVPWMRQISDGDDAIIGAQSVDAAGTTLSGVVIFNFDAQGNILMRQDASTAKLEHGYWLLNNVTQTRPGEIPKHLDSERMRTNLKQEFVQERLSQPETIGFFALPGKIALAKSLGVSPLGLETIYHSLLAMPLLLTAMAMIAGTVSLKFSRFSQSSTMIIGGILSGFMLYVVTMLAKAFGSSGVVAPFVAAWIPAIVAMSIGATILLHQEDG